MPKNEHDKVILSALAGEKDWQALQATAIRLTQKKSDGRRLTDAEDATLENYLAGTRLPERPTYPGTSELVPSTLRGFSAAANAFGTTEGHIRLLKRNSSPAFGGGGIIYSFILAEELARHPDTSTLDIPTPRGARTKLTKERLGIIREYLRKGGTKRGAAERAGVGETTLYLWLRQAESGEKSGIYLKLLQAVEGSQAALKAELTSQILSDPDWRAKAWCLERLFPTEYRKPDQHIEATGKDGAPLVPENAGGTAGPVVQIIMSPPPAAAEATEIHDETDEPAPEE